MTKAFPKIFETITYHEGKGRVWDLSLPLGLGKHQFKLTVDTLILEGRVDEVFIPYPFDVIHSMKTRVIWKSKKLISLKPEYYMLYSGFDFNKKFIFEMQPLEGETVVNLTYKYLLG